MPIIEPPAGRHLVQDDGTALEIIIPTLRNWATFIVGGLRFVLPGMIMVLIGGGILFNLILAAWHELERPSGGWVGDLLLGLLGLFLGGGLFIYGTTRLYAYSWDIAGKEIVQATGSSLVVSRQLFGYGRPHEYLAEHVRNLRVSDDSGETSWIDWWNRSIFGKLDEGAIAFDYGAKTFQFGLELDEAEAEQIVAAILRRFPQYGKSLLGVQDAAQR